MDVGLQWRQHAALTFRPNRLKKSLTRRPRPKANMSIQPAKIASATTVLGIRQGLIDALPRLHRFARMLCRPPLEPDDLIQATCERALSRQDQFAPDTRLDSWLFAIMHSIWKNDLRRLGTERASSTHSVSSPASVDGESVAIGKIFLAEVLSHLSRLPPDQAAAITLVNLDGLTYAAAADVLGIPQGTLESRIARGRIALGRLLDDKTANTTSIKSMQR
jgi:RNA polymerase sigma-70 factor, ECF subfamily